MTKNDTLLLVVFRPEGIAVRGKHSPETPAIPSAIVKSFQQRHLAWVDCVLGSDGGFDGPRAVLAGYDQDDDTLTLQTAYRTYTEGLALRDTIRDFELASTAAPTELRPELSWGLALSVFVLLPGESVLCAQRAQSLAVLPGRWSARHSEVVEPRDIDPVSMQSLLGRLVEEEMPVLKGLGIQKFVGLAVRPKLHEWQLVGVLDLRQVDLLELNQALTALAPDAETAAWAVCSVSRLSEGNAHESLQLLPAHLRYTGPIEPVDLAFARDLYEKVPPR